MAFLQGRSFNALPSFEDTSFLEEEAYQEASYLVAAFLVRYAFKEIGFLAFSVVDFTLKVGDKRKR